MTERLMGGRTKGSPGNELVGQAGDGAAEFGGEVAGAACGAGGAAFGAGS